MEGILVLVLQWKGILLLHQLSVDLNSRFEISEFDHLTNWIASDYEAGNIAIANFRLSIDKNVCPPLSWAFCHTVVLRSRELVVCDCSLPVGGVGIGWHRLECVVICAWTTPVHAKVSHIHFRLLHIFTSIQKYWISAFIALALQGLMWVVGVEINLLPVCNGDIAFSFLNGRVFGWTFS